MNTITRQLGLMLCGVLASAGIWACKATKNADGSWSYAFAPDMTITAWGLEDALSKLIDLMGQCKSGNFSRPCTASEIEEIGKVIENVLKRKERVLQSSPTFPLGQCKQC